RGAALHQRGHVPEPDGRPVHRADVQVGEFADRVAVLLLRPHDDVPLVPARAVARGLRPGGGVAPWGPAWGHAYPPPRQPLLVQENLDLPLARVEVDIHVGRPRSVGDDFLHLAGPTFPYAGIGPT